MDTATIFGVVGALAALGGTAYGVITFWMRLSDRIGAATAKAEAGETAASNANIAVAGMHLEIDRLNSELVEHRVAVAKEYVSKDTLNTLESRVIDAIDRLGQRLDNLFKQQNR